MKKKRINYKALARVFTSSFHSGNSACQARDFIERNGVQLSGVESQSIFSQVYAKLATDYQCEYVCKNELLRYELEIHQNDEFFMMNEVRVGASIADAVFFNGITHAVEVKSRLDNLNRLENQLADYRKIAPEVSVIAPTTYIDKISKEVDFNNVGLYTISDSAKVEKVRDSERDYGQIDNLSLLSLLRKSELEKIRENFGWDLGIHKPTLFRRAIASQFAKISKIEAEQTVRMLLKLRCQLSSPVCDNSLLYLSASSSKKIKHVLSPVTD